MSRLAARLRRLGADEGGWTLVELVVGLQLMLIVMFASLTTLEQFVHMGKRSERRLDLQEQARQAVRLMARDLRNVAGDADQADVVETDEPYELIFRAVDDDGGSHGANERGLKRVRYCLDRSDAARGRIHQQVQTWNSPSPPDMPSTTACPSDAWGDSRVVADRLVNTAGGQDRPVWSYRSSDGQVSSISIALWLDDDTAVEPKEVALSTGVFLRNQNRAPVAAFSATPVGTRHLLLNASESHDPEGQALQVVWYDGGREVGRGVVFDYAARTAGAHTIRLEVSDPSGLGDSAEQTVAVP